MQNWDDPLATNSGTNPAQPAVAAQALDLKATAPTPAAATVVDAAAVDAGATGLEDIEMGASRIRVDDKKIINCHADLNQLVPFKYEWAWTKS